jgi:release factor glutamine methyltransferase
MHSPLTQSSNLPPGLSVQSCWQIVVNRLTDTGNDCARQEATWLLQYVTRQSPPEFYSNLQRTLSTSETSQIQEHLSRRLRHEPVQYILGSAYFYGRDYYVDSRVLIPRPESELLIETTLEFLPDLPQQGGRMWLADVGTGSANIAVTLAYELPDARILAVDRSGEALQVARVNIATHSVGDRVHPVLGDLLTAMRRGLSAIVANLPYVRSQDIPWLSSDVSCFEPHEALDGGRDGLVPILRLCQQAPDVLLAGGRLLLEVGDGQADELVKHLSRTAVWDSIVTCADLRGVQRVVSARLAR